MKRLGLLLSAVIVLLVLLLWDKPIAQVDVEAAAPDGDLLARVEALEETIAGAPQRLEIAQLNSRLLALENALERVGGAKAPTRSSPERSNDAQFGREIGEISRTVSSFESKLSSTERSVGALKKEVASLRLSLLRLESNVGRLDYNR